MNLTTAQAFSAFLDGITATEYQRSTLMPNRKADVNKDLKDAFPSTSDLPYWKGILMGSAAKNTIIRPIDDIDVLAVFSNENKAWDTYWNNSSAFIYRIRNAYAGYKTQQVGTRGQAVRVFYNSGGHVDVAPVFFKGDDVYSLPNGSGGWISTAPTVANSWFSTKNAEFSYNLAPVVRLAKAWNRAHSHYFRSFHLETMVANAFATLGSNYRAALRVFFEWAPNHMYVTDPGGQGGDLSGYLGWNSRLSATQALNTAADRAAKAIAAEDEGNHTEAKRLWRIVLGEDFPL